MAPRQEQESSKHSYGSINIQDGLDDETLPLTNTNGRRPHHFWNKKRLSELRRDKSFAVAVIGLLLMGMLGLVVFHHNKPAGVTETAQHHKGDTFQLSPISMGLLSTHREEDASPSEIWGNITGPLPTNSWYLNLVSHSAAEQPGDSTSAYTVPYIIDTAPPSKKMAGIRVHWPVTQANARNIQMVDDFKNSVSLGSNDVKSSYRVIANRLSPLGVSLEWGNNETDKKSMVSHIVRGMAYATVQYLGGALPTVYSYNGPASAIKIDDGSEDLKCGVGKAGSTVSVEKEIQLHFINSDFTWILFFSRPVRIRCEVSEGDEKLRDFQLDVVSYEENDEDEPLTARLALLNPCTTGKSDITLHCRTKAQWKDQKEYEQLLKESAQVFPTSPQINFSYPELWNSYDQNAHMTIDWGARMTEAGGDSDEDDLLMFALPHHQDSIHSGKITDQCINTFHGSTCLVKGSKWKLSEDVGSPMSFTAPRPPEPDAIPALADAISRDIHYKLSSNLLRGAADTYFSGKILARVGRVIVIASELKKLAGGASSIEDVKSMYDDVDDESLSLSMKAASSAKLPSDKEISAAVEQLKKGVEVWLSNKAEAPYVYDKSWGGLVNCGCRYDGKGENGVCNNTFPDCPALADVNEDFGNGYYNDHHYHYGYHVYAAAVVAQFDPSWGIDHFDEVLLYIRDFANPSDDDEYFTQFRQKDWFLGSSWASGIVSAENSPHGRNEESSSEAIAAYEAVALYGAVMVDAFSKNSDDDGLVAAKLIRDAGQLLTATEVHATNRYWHVWSSDNHTSTYPEAYKQPVVGMLYETMASFQTWFAPEAVVSYGIQLMPFTPVAESRDDPEWATILYPLYKQSCEDAGDFCVDNGWSILQAGLLATSGDRESALKLALAVPTKVFQSQGGSGNSLTNTIWYVATRKPFNGGVKGDSNRTNFTSF